tara:strand:+ start:1 stop:975 length:975 start_codon:yes stop_codon:yes gene_type:complete
MRPEDGAYQHLEKVAHSMTGEDIVGAIWAADEKSGLNRYWETKVPDPFLSVLKIKTASEEKFTVGANDHVSAEQLQQLAASRRDMVATTFGESFASQFCKSPVTVFKSLPANTKTVLARLAASGANNVGVGDGAASIHREKDKEAALRVGDIEDRLGFYLDDKREEKTRGLIDKQKKKRFALRHPVLTGIPTLGIAPAVSKSRASKEVFKRLMRSDKELNKRHAKVQDKRRQEYLEDEKLDIERSKAEQPERAVGQASRAALAAIMAREKNKESALKVPTTPIAPARPAPQAKPLFGPKAVSGKAIGSSLRTGIRRPGRPRRRA